MCSVLLSYILVLSAHVSLRYKARRTWHRRENYAPSLLWLDWFLSSIFPEMSAVVIVRNESPGLCAGFGVCASASGTAAGLLCASLEGSSSANWRAIGWLLLVLLCRFLFSTREVTKAISWNDVETLLWDFSLVWDQTLQLPVSLGNLWHEDWTTWMICAGSVDADLSETISTRLKVFILTYFIGKI